MTTDADRTAQGKAQIDRLIAQGVSPAAILKGMNFIAAHNAHRAKTAAKHASTTCPVCSNPANPAIIQRTGACPSCMTAQFRARA